MNGDMLEYSEYAICLSEIPDEISLGISIIGCPKHCLDCHSPYLWDTAIGTGTLLTNEHLCDLINSQKHISCVLFLGGEWNHGSLVTNMLAIRQQYKTLKIALYSGEELEYFYNNGIIGLIDYLKVGSYNKTLGGLDSPITNQRLFTIHNGHITGDITNKFWRNNGNKDSRIV